MERYIRNLSANAEFACVVLLAFGYFIAASLASLSDTESSTTISDTHLLFLVVYEWIVMGFLVYVLRLRGWTASAVGLKPTLLESLSGLGLTATFYAMYFALALVLANTSGATAGSEQAPGFIASNLSLFPIFVVSIVNPIFEEGFVTGYVMSFLLERFSIPAAIAVSVSIRVLYHLYQGPEGAATVGLIGLMFAVYYARTGRLWPLIVAHGLLDLVPLLAAYAQQPA